MHCGVCGTDIEGRPSARNNDTGMLMCEDHVMAGAQLGLIYCALCPSCGFVYSKDATFLEAGNECPECLNPLDGGSVCSYTYAGQCAECGGYQWLRSDGSCVHGHPASSITGKYRPGGEPAPSKGDTDDDLDPSNVGAVADRMAELIRKSDAAYDRAAGGGPAYEALSARMRAIGQRLDDAGGSDLMALVAQGVAARGGRVRDCELYWNGIGGWMY